MNKVIVSDLEPIVLVGGGPLGKHDISTVLRPGYRMVACDGGARHVRAEGLEHRLEAIIGDLDSLGEGAWPGVEVIAVEEQDTTDFDKALRHMSAPVVLALGVWGGRADHTLASLSVLARHADRPVLIAAGEDCLFLAPPEMSLQLPPGTRLSLWPLAEVRGVSEGLEWPIEGLTLRPEGRIGTSNRVTRNRVSLQIDRPDCFVIMPITQWEAAIQALVQAPRWPARAG